MFNWRIFVADAIFECHAHSQRNSAALHNNIYPLSCEALQRFIEALSNLTRSLSLPHSDATVMSSAHGCTYLLTYLLTYLVYRCGPSYVMIRVCRSVKGQVHMVSLFTYVWYCLFAPLFCIVWYRCFLTFVLWKFSLLFVNSTDEDCYEVGSV